MCEVVWAPQVLEGRRRHGVAVHVLAGGEARRVATGTPYTPLPIPRSSSGARVAGSMVGRGRWRMRG